MVNIEKYMAPVFVAETRGDESLQRLLGNQMPGRRVVHREDIKRWAQPTSPVSRDTSARSMRSTVWATR